MASCQQQGCYNSSQARGVLARELNQGRREGEGQRGKLVPGPKQVGASNLRNILKLNKAPSKSGRVQGINGCIKRH